MGLLSFIARKDDRHHHGANSELTQLVEEHRKAVSGVYEAAESVRKSTASMIASAREQLLRNQRESKSYGIVKEALDRMREIQAENEGQDEPSYHPFDLP